MPTDLGGLQLPGQARHDIHRISTAHANSAHAQSTSIHSVRVCADHHAPWEGIVLQHDLQAGAQRNQAHLRAESRAAAHAMWTLLWSAFTHKGLLHAWRP
jgi:hypothetical protein